MRSNIGNLRFFYHAISLNSLPNIVPIPLVEGREDRPVAGSESIADGVTENAIHEDQVLGGGFEWLYFCFHGCVVLC